jgi:hypothetical protein
VEVLQELCVNATRKLGTTVARAACLNRQASILEVPQRA